jgi:hypothetical protein
VKEPTLNETIEMVHSEYQVKKSLVPKWWKGMQRSFIKQRAAGRQWSRKDGCPPMSCAHCGRVIGKLSAGGNILEGTSVQCMWEKGHTKDICWDREEKAEQGPCSFWRGDSSMVTCSFEGVGGGWTWPKLQA